MKKDSMIRCKTQTNLRTWSRPATRPWQRTQTQRCGLQKWKYPKAKLGFGTGKRRPRFFLFCGPFVEDNKKLSNTQTRVSLTVISESLITTWYERGSRSSVRRGNYWFGGDVTQNDPTFNQHDLNPAIAAPLLLWCALHDWPRHEGFSLPVNRRHKQEQGRTQSRKL
jgi:hypothetical protein